MNNIKHYYITLLSYIKVLVSYQQVVISFNGNTPPQYVIYKYINIIMTVIMIFNSSNVVAVIAVHCVTVTHLSNEDNDT